MSARAWSRRTRSLSIEGYLERGHAGASISTPGSGAPALPAATMRLRHRPHVTFTFVRHRHQGAQLKPGTLALIRTGI